MAKYLVEVSQNMTRTYEVEAETPREAEERYPDNGTVINSETSSPEVMHVTRT